MTALKDPSAHCVHVEAPAPLYDPAGQLEHAKDPAEAAYEPAGQLEHTEDPVEEAYEPREHGVHAEDPPSLNVPTSHGIAIASSN